VTIWIISSGSVEGPVAGTYDAVGNLREGEAKSLCLIKHHSMKACGEAKL
jgi:hypothetical protein